MKFWQALSFTETDQLVDLARSCEAVGFHGALLSDHVVYPETFEPLYPYAEGGRPEFDAETEWPEPWCAISAMATATERLHFSTAVYIAPLRHPLAVAKSLSVTSILSGGRTALGAGVGWLREEFEIFGEDYGTRGRRLDESIEIYRKAWAGETFEHHGRYYDFDRLSMSPAPSRPIPIYIGGQSPPALRRAARNDGWIGTGNAPEEVSGILETLHRERRTAGVSGDFEVILALTTPPDFDLWRRLEDQGVTSMISYPLVYSVGPGASLDVKQRALEQYAEAIIAKY